MAESAPPAVAWQGRLFRCIGCGEVGDTGEIRLIRHPHSGRRLNLCHQCWADCLDAVRRRCCELGDLLDDLVDHDAGVRA